MCVGTLEDGKNREANPVEEMVSLGVGRQEESASQARLSYK